MNRHPIVPCLWLDDQAEAAASLYTGLFPGGRVTAVSRYPTAFDNPGGKPRGSVLTVEFEVAGQPFTAMNGGPQFRPDPSISFFFHADDPGEVDRLFGALSEGGRALMPLDRYPWSERYAWVEDRFGVSWQLMAGGLAPGEPPVAPCLMFSGTRHGQAERALRTWADILPGGRVEALERYAPGEGPEGTVKHGRLTVGGQRLVAMDSHLEQDLTFSEGVSLQWMCDTQDEVDRLWAALGAGGRPGPCGWLQDRFGVTWQVVPRAVSEWLLSEDAAARDRTFEALLEMGKLDLGTLQAAYEGR